MDIDFSHAGATGRARVAWNRISGDTIETGFVVCGTPPPERRAQGARSAGARQRPAARPAAPGGARRRR
jgi:hypothetical protein